MSDHDIKVLMERIQATIQFGKSQLHTRGYDIPAVRCIQRVARRLDLLSAHGRRLVRVIRVRVITVMSH